jgi:hypothetical protein
VPLSYNKGITQEGIITGGGQPPEENGRTGEDANLRIFSDMGLKYLCKSGCLTNLILIMYCWMV